MALILLVPQIKCHKPFWALCVLHVGRQYCPPSTVIFTQTRWRFLHQSRTVWGAPPPHAWYLPQSSVGTRLSQAERQPSPPEAALACLAVDPAILLIVVGVLMFLLTFCGCIGSLRENICLLQTFSLCLTIVFLLQLAAGVLGFVFSDKARGKVNEIINNAIVHYRDDLDLQNLIDFGQKKFGCCGGISYKDWSLNMYFNCSEDNPSRERCSVPYSCCLPVPNQAVINTMCGQGMQALDYLEASKIIYTNGCIDRLVNWIHSNLFVLGGVALGLAIPQLVGILLSMILMSQIKDQIKLQLYNQQHRADPWY
uniref:Tetraspanin-33 n=1 Tax=Sus scrofa TaxID=9823 RepID=A0A8D1MMB8_PIG